ncbi:MAG: CheR family methyltransferase, partial [Nevskiales bacterium]
VRMLACICTNETRFLSLAGAFRVSETQGVPRLESSRRGGPAIQAYLKSYMLRGVGSQEGMMKAGDTIRRLVEFRRLNLNANSYPVEGKFDLIFCRNVLIYFTQESKNRVLSGLLHHLAPGGNLFLGHSETLNLMHERLRSMGPAIFALLEEANPSRP